MRSIPAPRRVHVDWLIDKLPHAAPEAVFIAFPFNLGAPSFMLDLNGIPAVPNDDQLDGAARDWYPLQRWVDVGDGARGVTVVPLDAPLRPSRRHHDRQMGADARARGPDHHVLGAQQPLDGEFQGEPRTGAFRLRYRLTTHEGAVDPAAAARFAADVSVPPVVLRDIAPKAARSGSFFTLEPDAPVLATAKPGEAPGLVALRLQNLANAPTKAVVTFGKAPASARLSDPVEHEGASLAPDGNRISVDLRPLAIATVLVGFGGAWRAESTGGERIGPPQAARR